MTFTKLTKSWDPLANCLLQFYFASRNNGTLVKVGNKRYTASSWLCARGNKGNTALPPEPQNCCMSGCANCVWIRYAEEVSKLVENGDELAKAKIIEHVKDPNLRAFLKIELDHIFNKKR